MSSTDKYNEFLNSSDDVLEKFAENISENIVIRVYDKHGSRDYERHASTFEHETLRRIAFACMCSIRKSGMNMDMVEGALDMAESLMHLELPEANAYCSIYIPIKKITGLWEME